MLYCDNENLPNQNNAAKLDKIHYMTVMCGLLLFFARVLLVIYDFLLFRSLLFRGFVLWRYMLSFFLIILYNLHICP